MIIGWYLYYVKTHFDREEEINRQENIGRDPSRDDPQ